MAEHASDYSRKRRRQVLLVMVLSISLFVFQLTLAFLVGHLLLLVIASLSAARTTHVPNFYHRWRFLILVPAHNEERLLPDLLESISRLNYPGDLFSVHVVADNCIDNTAGVAQQNCAHVHIRTDRERRGKGYALNWLMSRLHQAQEPHDAVVFFDADSIVSPNFLKIMAARLERGERVIQAYYSVRDPGLSWAGSLRYAALAVLHFLRPMGRMTLGTSVGLKGNGMVFAADLIRRHAWSSSLTEDIDMHMALLFSGERVTFAPDGVVWGEMPESLTNAGSQNMRWEQGRKEMARKYIPKLFAAVGQELANGRFKRVLILVDALIDHLQPPFSILFGANILSLAVSIVLFMLVHAGNIASPFIWLDRLALGNILLAVLLLLGQIVYLFIGLRLVSAPKQVYMNLLHAPQLVLWKIWLVILVLFGQGQHTWVRTKRNGG